MYLRDLAVTLSDGAKLPRGYDARTFHDSTHAVVERYLDLLPRRKVKLADAAKLNIMVGPRSRADIGSEEDFHVYPDGVGFLWLDDFGLDIDLHEYAATDRTAQQRMLLTGLHEGLMAAARRAEAESIWFEQANETLRAQSFPLSDFSEDKLRRRWGLLPKPRKRAKMAASRKKKPTKKRS